MALFCSLKAFSTNGLGEYGCTLLSSPRGENSHPSSSVNPHKKAINHSCLPGFHQNSVHPAYDQAFLSPAYDFQNSQILGTPIADSRFPLGEGILPGFCLLLDPVQESSCTIIQLLQFMAIQSRKPVPRLTVFSRLHHSCAWELCHIQASLSFL